MKHLQLCITTCIINFLSYEWNVSLTMLYIRVGHGESTGSAIGLPFWANHNREMFSTPNQIFFSPTRLLTQPLPAGCPQAVSRWNFSFCWNYASIEGGICIRMLSGESCWWTYSILCATYIEKHDVSTVGTGYSQMPKNRYFVWLYPVSDYSRTNTCLRVLLVCISILRLFILKI